MHRASWKSSSFPRITGVQWSSIVGSTLWGYGAGRGCRPGHRPWSCGDHAGVLAAPAGGVAAFRRSCKPGSCPGQGRSRFRESCPCRSGVPRKGKYERGMGSWQHSSWSSAEHVLHCVAGSHSVITASGMVEQ